MVASLSSPLRLLAVPIQLLFSCSSTSGVPCLNPLSSIKWRTADDVSSIGHPLFIFTVISTAHPPFLFPMQLSQPPNRSPTLYHLPPRISPPSAPVLAITQTVAGSSWASASHLFPLNSPYLMLEVHFPEATFHDPPVIWARCPCSMCNYINSICLSSHPEMKTLKYEIVSFFFEFSAVYMSNQERACKKKISK